MLKDKLKERFTAKWWEAKELEQEKLEYILDSIYLAPSKNGRYNYSVYVITNSPQGQELKEWLYWDNTFCLDGVNGKEGPGLRRYNGQVLAPVTLMWIAKNNDAETRDDCLVSATVGMCAALELGLQTGFNSCIDMPKFSSKMNTEGYAVTALGIGYAQTDFAGLRDVYRQGEKVGFDYSNTNPSIRSFPNRKNKPAFDSLFNFI